MARSDPQVNIRMPQQVKDRLEVEAKASGRSLNAEIVARLQQTLEQARGTEEVQNSLIIVELRAKAAALDQQISILKSVLRNAAGVIRTALISGRSGKIPESDAKWMTEEADHFSKIAAEYRINIGAKDSQEDEKP